MFKNGGKRILSALLVGAMFIGLLSGCGKTTTEERLEALNAESEYGLTIARDDNGNVGMILGKLSNKTVKSPKDALKVLSSLEDMLGVSIEKNTIVFFSYS